MRYQNSNTVKSTNFLPLHIGKRSKKATNFSLFKSTPTPNVQCLTKLNSSQCSETHGNCKTGDLSKNHHQSVTAGTPLQPSREFAYIDILENLLLTYKLATSKVRLKLSCNYELFVLHHYLYFSAIIC